MRKSKRAGWAVWFAAMGISVVGSGCASATPVTTEREGLLERIARADHSRQTRSFARADRSPAARKHARSQDKGAIEVNMGQLQWPLHTVQITSQYGKRGGDFHEGVDLRAKSGTPVYAAQEGTIIYAGNKIRGYGKLVVIRHFREISTVYAHNSRLLVRTGQFVRQGQKIAISGNTGHSSGPHLHFEVRDGLAALDPMGILPAYSKVAGEPAIGALPTAPLVSHETAIGGGEESPFPIPPREKKVHRAKKSSKSKRRLAMRKKASGPVVAAREVSQSGSRRERVQD